MIGCISHYKAHSKPHFMVSQRRSGAQKVPNRKDQKQTLRDPDGSLAVKIRRWANHRTILGGARGMKKSWVSPWDFNSEKSWDMVPIY